MYRAHMRIATAIRRRSERRPMDASEVHRNMMWNGQIEFVHRQILDPRGLV